MINKTFILFFGIILTMSASYAHEENEMHQLLEDRGWSFIKRPVKEKAVAALTEKHGEGERFRILHGVKQCADFWTKEDGTEAEFIQFCTDNFLSDAKKLHEFFEKFSGYYEILLGHFNKLSLELQKTLQLDLGPITAIDKLFGGFDPSAHLTEDLFKTKVAHSVVLNFPHYSLAEKTKYGDKWSRKEWAYARMGDIFASRVPAHVLQELARILSESDTYIADYNVHMGKLVDAEGKKHFPEAMKLITHWGLRDELKGQYSQEGGLKRQEMIFDVMQRIIRQEIPQCVINSSEYEWNPSTNEVFQAGKKVDAKSEPNARYQHMIDNFHSMKKLDPYYPDFPTAIWRAFEMNMEISVEEVEKIFIDYLSSPLTKGVAQLIEKRIGRKLRPYDIWYQGFKPRISLSQEKLDKMISERYKTHKDFEKEIPNILLKLGFTAKMAEHLSGKITVDPSRGAGHAWGPEMRTEKARLRTRVTQDGMDYKGFNVGMHELGHNCEQILTLYNVDYYMLRGVPNTAFTEAWAFVFQARDFDMLGIKEQDANADHLRALDSFWSTREIMAVSLVDIQTWKWLYAHPHASSAELKEAVLDAARKVWNAYYADSYGTRDEIILGIYSHMIAYPLYLSAYPIGHMIEMQMEKQMEGKDFGLEMERICTYGKIIPQQWMRHAVGSPLSAKAVLENVEEALKHIK